MILSYKKKMK